MLQGLYWRIERAAASRKAMLRRFAENPIIRPDMLPAQDCANINGPSLVRVPEWAPGRLGNYYLYFAHHHGTYIRLAFADDLRGPWSIHPPGVLQLTDTACRGHIASPDVHVDDQRREFRMYFHGPIPGGEQMTFAARSRDGLSFTASSAPLAPFYLRAVPWAGEWIGMTWGGQMHRSPDGLAPFQTIPGAGFKMSAISRRGPVRHVALQLRGSALLVYYTRIGDAPERIFRSRIDLDRGPWRPRGRELIAAPETGYEGADLPIVRSKLGAAPGREHALRDPAIFVEDGREYLLYAVAGETGIGIAELLA